MEIKGKKGRERKERKRKRKGKRKEEERERGEKLWNRDTGRTRCSRSVR